MFVLARESAILGTWMIFITDMYLHLSSMAVLEVSFDCQLSLWADSCRGLLRGPLMTEVAHFILYIDW